MQGQAHSIKNPPVTQPHHSLNCSRMARTYPLTFDYNEFLGRKANPLSFTSLRLIDIRNGHSQYLSTIGQLVVALPKLMDPASRFALQGHIARPGQTRLRHSMRAANWFLLPSDRTFRQSSSSLQYFFIRQVRCVVLRGGDVTLPPWERYLNWVHETTPPPSRDHSKENLPPTEEPLKLPRKMRPCKIQGKHHHQHPLITGSQPGTSQSPSPAMSTQVKHPQTFQHPQHPQPPSSATNHISGRPNLLDQAELGRLYKPARSSISKESTTRSRRDNFSGSNLSFTGLQRSHRDYFSWSPSGQINKNVTLTDPYREARTAVSKRSGPAQTPPRIALPDVHLDIGAALPEAAATCRIPHADRPPVVLDIPGSTLEPSEPNRRTDSPSRGPRPPRRGHKWPRNPLSPFVMPPQEATFHRRQMVRIPAPLYRHQKVLGETLIPRTQQSAIKDIPTTPLDPLVLWPSNKGSPGHPTLLIPCKKILKEKSKRVAFNKGYPATVSKELGYQRWSI